MNNQTFTFIISILKMVFDEDLLSIRVEDVTRQVVKGGVAVYVVGAMLGQGCRQFLLSIEPETPTFTIN